MVIETPDLIDSVPTDELGRRGGRVLSQSPAAVRARDLRARVKAEGGGAPKRRGRPPGGKSRMPRTPKSLYPEIVAFLTMTNTLVTLTPLGSKYEPTGKVDTIELAPGFYVPMPEMRQISLGDELDQMEIAHLAKSLDAQCQRSPRFKKYVETFLGVAAGGGILTIVAMIVARRAARHGIIDPSLDVTFGRAMQGDLSALAEFAPSPPPDQTPDNGTGEVAPVPGAGGDADEADPRDGFAYE